MKVRDILNINAVRILSGSTMAQAAELAAMSNASGLFVVDAENSFVGVLSEGDMMRAVLPQMSDVYAAGGSLGDSYDIFGEKGAQLASEKIDDHLISDPISLSPDDTVLKAASIMAMKHMRRLPVLKDGKLVGTVSRGDICKAVLK
ncbi:hypothetical protein JCM17960_34650 [Magnetospira thiophila]